MSDNRTPQHSGVDLNDQGVCSLMASIHVPFDPTVLHAARNYITSCFGLNVSFFRLQEIDLSNNAIETLEGLGDLVQLRTLRLSHNLITSFHGLHGVPQLTTLYLDHNRILTLEGLQPLPHLECLHLEGNPISAYLDVRTTALMLHVSGCTYLRKFSIGNTDVQHLNVGRDDVAMSDDLSLVVPSAIRLGWIPTIAFEVVDSTKWNNTCHHELLERWNENALKQCYPLLIIDSFAAVSDASGKIEWSLCLQDVRDEATSASLPFQHQTLQRLELIHIGTEDDVVLWGSFNHWSSGIQTKRMEDGIRHIAVLYVTQGTYTFRFGLNDCDHTELETVVVGANDDVTVESEERLECLIRTEIGRLPSVDLIHTIQPHENNTFVSLSLSVRMFDKDVCRFSDSTDRRVTYVPPAKPTHEEVVQDPKVRNDALGTSLKNPPTSAQPRFLAPMLSFRTSNVAVGSPLDIYLGKNIAKDRHFQWWKIQPNLSKRTRIHGAEQFRYIPTESDIGYLLGAVDVQSKQYVQTTETVMPEYPTIHGVSIAVTRSLDVTLSYTCTPPTEQGVSVVIRWFLVGTRFEELESFEGLCSFRLPSRAKGLKIKACLTPVREVDQWFGETVECEASCDFLSIEGAHRQEGIVRIDNVDLLTECCYVGIPCGIAVQYTDSLGRPIHAIDTIRIRWYVNGLEVLLNGDGHNLWYTPRVEEFGKVLQIVVHHQGSVVYTSPARIVELPENTLDFLLDKLFQQSHTIHTACQTLLCINPPFVNIDRHQYEMDPTLISVGIRDGNLLVFTPLQSESPCDEVPEGEEHVIVFDLESECELVYVLLLFFLEVGAVVGKNRWKKWHRIGLAEHKAEILSQGIEEGIPQHCTLFRKVISK
eukprot:PhF_6_TR37619/c1_g1_i2/m.55917